MDISFHHGYKLALVAIVVVYYFPTNYMHKWIYPFITAKLALVGIVVVYYFPTVYMHIS